ncbi:hypothetical protein DXT96_06840 [Agrobacterium sp. ICMP 6402]|uniref:hypothetical protein n=1 Tax=Agrobacterium sp. ICMP 6402 TaxID=2292443 RepID=UPI001294BE2A|nr:hypothetical protein [Agrobacterium sp. ICMP 6402]MQB09571.1 hypothetical protein [Agrobacterium sp. ICMP 6402]
MGRENIEGLVPPSMRFKRTEMQEEADEIDLEIYRLIGRIERFATTTVFKDEVMDSATRLQQARYAIRSLMHPKDREQTNG